MLLFRPDIRIIKSSRNRAKILFNSPLYFRSLMFASALTQKSVQNQNRLEVRAYFLFIRQYLSFHMNQTTINRKEGKLLARKIAVRIMRCVQFYTCGAERREKKNNKCFASPPSLSLRMLLYSIFIFSIFILSFLCPYYVTKYTISSFRIFIPH